MKCIVIFIPLVLSLAAFAHKSVKVQSLEAAAAKYTQEAPQFADLAKVENPKYLKTLSASTHGDLRLYKFEVLADWGPIHGLLAVERGQVRGLEILVYTKHAGAGVTMPVFLDQYKALNKDNHKAASIKPLPDEPKTSLALKEVIDIVLSL